MRTATGMPAKAFRPLAALSATAFSVLALSACVSSTTEQMYGYTPGSPVPSVAVDSSETAVSAEGAAEVEMTAATGQPSGEDAQLLATQSSQTIPGQTDPGQTVTALAPAQSAQPSVDALNRGITQNATATPGGNLYALAQSEPGTPTMVPLPDSAPRSVDAAQQSVAESASSTLAAQPADAPQAETAAVEPLVEPAAESTKLTALAPPQQKTSIFGRLFGSTTTPPKNVPNAARRGAPDNSLRSDIRVTRASASSGDGLPGVRLSSLFGIQSGTDEDGENASGVEVASAAGLARLAPRGLHIQTDRVDVTCLKPRLVNMIKKVEKHYGRPAIVTSGYRNPKHNRKIGGARNSRHTTCEAADIQVDGVTKWQLATYLRSIPGRGGVGTYCHTQSVHLDIGTERDWNWRCRRRKK